MTQKTETAKDIREDVSAFYAEAASTPGASCCGGASGQKGIAARVAGYREGELSELPADAVENSFGCGNPVAFAGVGKGESVLDLGSGAGIDLLLAAEKVGPGGHVIGIDMTDVMIDKARANIAAAGLDNVEVRKGFIEALPVEANSVDWVISNCVINLSPDKPKVFAEIARVLKPGGRISVSDIVADELPDWARQSAAIYASCVGGTISEGAYKGGLEAAGLEAVEVTDRLVYETSQLAGLLRSELPGVEAALEGRDLDELAGAIEGKVWSARFTARKPLS